MRPIIRLCGNGVLSTSALRLPVDPAIIHKSNAEKMGIAGKAGKTLPAACHGCVSYVKRQESSGYSHG